MKYAALQAAKLLLLAVLAVLLWGILHADPQQADFSVLREQAEQATGGSAAALHLAELLLTWGGQGDLEQIRAAFGTRDPNPAIRQLVDGGAAKLVTSAQRGIGDKTEKLAVLAMPAEEAMSLVAPRRRTRRSPPHCRER